MNPCGEIALNLPRIAITGSTHNDNDPDQLVRIDASAHDGFQFVVLLGNQHDNFSVWDDETHQWIFHHPKLVAAIMDQGLKYGEDYILDFESKTHTLTFESGHVSTVKYWPKFLVKSETTWMLMKLAL